MKRLIAIALLAAACGGPAPSPSIASAAPSPAVSIPSSAPSIAQPSSSSSAGPSIDASIVAERAPGVTLKPGDSGAVDAKGGRYRIAWLATGCSTLTIEWAPAGAAAIPVKVVLPSGETFVDLPAGKGFLNRAGDCPFVVRFEASS